MQNLSEVAKKLVADNKGILAADASNSTMNKRLEAIGVEQNPEMRRQYRQMLFSTKGIEQYVSGVILYDETIRQHDDSGMPLREILENKGIMPGIKVDQGLVENPESPEEQVTAGLQKLEERLSMYRDMGATFDKWRATYTIEGQELPTKEDINLDAWILAQYAKVSQESGLVPMIEPEVLMSGSHTIARCAEVTKAVQARVFSELKSVGVSFPGAILKTNMVLPGSESQEKATSEEVAEHTLAVLRENVPEDIGGVVFLSGGQAPREATENLQAIVAKGGFPWPITFSYSRALQEPVMAAWSGERANVEEAQRIFLHRLKMNSLAREGKYTRESEDELDL